MMKVPVPLQARWVPSVEERIKMLSADPPPPPLASNFRYPLLANPPAPTVRSPVDSLTQVPPEPIETVPAVKFPAPCARSLLIVKVPVTVAFEEERSSFPLVIVKLLLTVSAPPNVTVMLAAFTVTLLKGSLPFKVWVPSNSTVPLRGVKTPAPVSVHPPATLI